MKRFIGVLPCLITYPGSPSTDSRYGDNALQWLFSPNERFSLTNFVRDVTGGLVEIQPNVFPITQFIFDDPAIGSLLDVTTSTNRSEIAAKLWDAAEQNGIHLGIFHGTQFFILGRDFNAGSTVVMRDGAQPVSVLTDRGSHAFFAHELMHVLGFDHAFLVTNQKYYKHGEYADPTCIMSAENFGGHGNVMFQLTPDGDNDDDRVGDTSTISIDAALWNRAGPGVSAASLWRYYPGFPNEQPWTRFISPSEPAVRVSLNIPSANLGTKLVVMPDLFGAGWWTAELRKKSGWDRSLRQASSGDMDVSDAAGVVLHRIQDVGVSQDGAGWPKDRVVCYQGTIPVPSTGNDDWSSGLFSARVTGPGGTGLVVGRSLPNLEAVRLEELDRVEDVTDAIGFKKVRSALVGPSCGVGELSLVDRSTKYTIALIAAANGFVQPAFRFALNGQPIGDWSAIVSPTQQRGTEPVSVTVETPINHLETESGPGVINVSWDLLGNKLVFAVDGGQGRFPLQVSVEVGDATLPKRLRPPKARAVQTFDLCTGEILLSEGAREALNQCATYLGHWKRYKDLGPADILGPISVPDDWRGLDREQLAKAIGNLELLFRTNPRAARDVAEKPAKHLGVSPGRLMQAIRQVEQFGQH